MKRKYLAAIPLGALAVLLLVPSAALADSTDLVKAINGKLDSVDRDEHRCG